MASKALKAGNVRKFLVSVVIREQILVGERIHLGLPQSSTL